MKKTLLVFGIAAILCAALFNAEFVEKSAAQTTTTPVYNPEMGMSESISATVQMTMSAGMSAGGYEEGVPTDFAPVPPVGVSGGGGATNVDTTPKWIITRKLGDEVVVWGSEFDKMLDLTPEQTNDLQAVTERLRPTFSQEDIHARAVADGINGILPLAEVQKRINQTLTPDQQSQYVEMSFQAGGGLNSYHLNDQFLEVLNLTAAQKNQIRKISAELDKERWEEQSAWEKEIKEQLGEPEPYVPKPFVPTPYVRTKPIEPIDWENATQAERDKYIADQVADQVAHNIAEQLAHDLPDQIAHNKAVTAPFHEALVALQQAHSEKDEARTEKYMERIKTVLTPAQKAKAEKLTAEAPALIAKMGFFRQPGQGGEVRSLPIYVPGEGSWRPGRPMPGGAQPPRNEPGRFPRANRSE